MTGSATEFERLLARAELLAKQGGAAEAALRFAAEIYREQARLAAGLHGLPLLSGRIEEDLPGAAPEALAFWRGDPADPRGRTLLRPYVALLAQRGVRPDRTHPAGYCEFCGGAPWVASRVSEASSDGAARRVHCSLCGVPWQVNRIRCVSCGEETPEKLPIFQTETYPEARIEACETCKVYVKSIDLTTDARRIPEVDDLLSVPLDLWAQEEGFGRLEPGMAGV